MREEPEISLQSAARLPIFPTTQQKEIQPARPCHVVRSNSRLHTPIESGASLDRVSPADISSSPSRIHQRSPTVIYVRGTRPDRTARYAAKPERNYRLASRPASVPKVSGSPHQARDAKVDGETPPAAFEARRAHGGTPAPCRRTSPIESGRARTREWRRQERRIACQKPQVSD
ncbi:hypothetical protein quinque_006398 [Culex quinquefasciatus]